MAIDIWLINSGNPINNYSTICNYPSPTGINAGCIYEGRVNNTLTIDQIDDKFDNRFVPQNLEA